MEADPKSLAGALVAFRLSNMNHAPRCMARTRRGTPCQCPATRGRARCRLHGGAVGSGGPKGERNGAFKSGVWTAEAVALRRAAAALVTSASGFRKRLKGAGGGVESLVVFGVVRLSGEALTTLIRPE